VRSAEKIFPEDVKLFLSDGDSPVAVPVNGGSKFLNMAILEGTFYEGNN
jgi:hypothetical protein